MLDVLNCHLSFFWGGIFSNNYRDTPKKSKLETLTHVSSYETCSIILHWFFTNRRKSCKSSTDKHPYSNLCGHEVDLQEPSKVFIMKLMQGGTMSSKLQYPFSPILVEHLLPKRNRSYCNKTSGKWLEQYLEEELGHYFSTTTCHMIPCSGHMNNCNVHLIIPYIYWSYIRFLIHKTCSMKPPAGCLPHVTKRKRQSVLSQPPTSANLLLKRKRVGNHGPLVALSSCKWNPRNLQWSEPTERTPQKPWISI